MPGGRIRVLVIGPTRRHIGLTVVWIGKELRIAADFKPVRKIDRLVEIAASTTTPLDRLSDVFSVSRSSQSEVPKQRHPMKRCVDQVGDQRVVRRQSGRCAR